MTTNSPVERRALAEVRMTYGLYQRFLSSAASAERRGHSEIAETYRKDAMKYRYAAETIAYIITGRVALTEIRKHMAALGVVR